GFYSICPSLLASTCRFQDNMSIVTVDLKKIFGETAKLAELPKYIENALTLAGEGNEVILTGQAPVWLYLSIAHALHGKVMGNSQG
ncbi:MAG: CRISPR-associated protein Csx3, partial [bacterium]|nr:CRISPR-associated protein Csx3 [bacterium]